MRIHLHTASGRIRTIDLAYTARTEPLALRLLSRVKVRDEEMGHEFHGNQYTDVPGTPKPTSTKATTSKAAVHELLSTGHQFTFEELMKVTGAKSALSLQTAISDLKNPKYAGPTGSLEILKLKSGHYYVGKPSAPVAAEKKPAPAAAPMPSLLTPSEEASLVAKGVVKAPAEKMSSSAASKVYEDKMAEVLKESGKMAAYPGSTIAEAAAHFKNNKAKAMAQYAANTKGLDQVPNKVEVYQEDKDLVLAIVNGKSPLAAYAEWKTATAQAKNKPTPSTPTAPVNPAPTVVKAAPEKPPLQLPAGGHQPHFPAVPNYVPHDHVGITKEDFKTGAFHTGLNNAGSLLSSNSKGDVANKKKIQQDLEHRLQDSKAFQAVSSQVTKKLHGSFAATLISTWASTSGDSHPVAVAQQLSVRDAFDMDQAHLSTGNMSALHKGTHQDDAVFKAAAEKVGFPYKTEEQKTTFRAGMRDFILAQYHNTQDWMKEKGVTHMYLARGMGGEEKVKGAEHGRLKLQPVSSFSSNYSTARRFASGKNVYMVKVPREQILGSCLTGFGCTSEHEVVVLAHKDIAAVKTSVGDAATVTEAVGKIKGAFGYGPPVVHTAPTSTFAAGPAPPKAMLAPAKVGVPQAEVLTSWTKKFQNAANTGGHEEFKKLYAELQEFKKTTTLSVAQASKYAATLKAHFEGAAQPMAPKEVLATIPAAHIGKKITGLPETTMKNGTVSEAKKAGWAGDLKKLKQLQEEKKYSYGVTNQAIKVYLGKLVIHLEKKGITE